MPEGHTIHRAARDHTKDLGGQRIRITSPQGRLDTSKLVDETGHTKLRTVEAHGKHLFYFFDNGRIVHVHLGLFGRFYRKKSPPPAPGASTRMRLEGSTRTIDLVGPTACEVLTRREMNAILDRLGPDPLRDDADPTRFYDHLARSKMPIGVALLDQSVISGVGNVYRAEVLHLLRIHPLTEARDLPRAKQRALWRLIQGLLRRGVEEKRIVTTKGLTLAKPRERIVRAESTHVYGMRTCRTCGEPTSRFLLRARVVHYCGRCQPLAEPEA